MTLLNFISNIILTLSGMIFFLQLYGRNSSIVHKWTLVSHWRLKVGLAAFIAGSFFNVLTVGTPPTSQIMSNFGLSAIFSWAVMFHYKMFSNYKKK